jgi:hypothetical protein
MAVIRRSSAHYRDWPFHCYIYDDPYGNVIVNSEIDNLALGEPQFSPRTRGRGNCAHIPPGQSPSGVTSQLPYVELTPSFSQTLQSLH